jgi:hypothetical protein
LGAKLNAKGIETYRVLFPKGMDANEYAKKVGPANKSLGLVLRNAEWMGKGAAPAVVATPPASEEPGDEGTPSFAALSAAACVESAEPTPAPMLSEDDRARGPEASGPAVPREVEAPREVFPSLVSSAA